MYKHIYIYILAEIIIKVFEFQVFKERVILLGKSIMQITKHFLLSKYNNLSFISFDLMRDWKNIKHSTYMKLQLYYIPMYSTSYILDRYLKHILIYNNAILTYSNIFLERYIFREFIPIIKTFSKSIFYPSFVLVQLMYTFEYISNLY